MRTSLIGRGVRAKHVDRSGTVVAVAMHEGNFWLLVETSKGELEMYSYRDVLLVSEGT